QYADAIKEHFPKLPRRVSGYNLDQLVKPDFCNISKLITGSEGSLGLITEVTLRICKRPQHVAMVLIATKDMLQGLEHTQRYLEYKPFALEMIDRKIIAAGRLSPTLQGRLSWLEG